MESALAARIMLQLALLAREKAQDDTTKVSEAVLEEFGLTTIEASQELKDFLRDRAEMIEETAQFLSEDGVNAAFAKRGDGLYRLVQSRCRHHRCLIRYCYS